MPIYKISRRNHAENRAKAVYVRTRLLALLLSGVLVLGTILILFGGTPG